MPKLPSWREALYVGLALMVAALLVRQTEAFSGWSTRMDVWQGRTELRIEMLENSVQAYHPLVPLGGTD